MSNAIEVDKDNFQEKVISSDIPVLVDFWAEWCGPCKMIAPVLDEIASELAGIALVTKVNVDDNQELAAKYSIRSIPSLLLFKGGELKEQLTGVQPKDVILNKLKNL